MSEQDGLIAAAILDGRGGGREIGWPEIEAWAPDQGILWVHLDRTGAKTRQWLADSSGLDAVVCQTLLQDDVRPHEVADRTLRYVEDLDTARERAAVTMDELSTRLSEQMNRTMYLLTVVAAVLLPPSLITGLFGINVGGMPGIESPWAFPAVVTVLVMIAVAEVLILRRLRWI